MHYMVSHTVSQTHGIATSLISVSYIALPRAILPGLSLPQSDLFTTNVFRHCLHKETLQSLIVTHKGPCRIAIAHCRFNCAKMSTCALSSSCTEASRHMMVVFCTLISLISRICHSHMSMSLPVQNAHTLMNSASALPREAKSSNPGTDTSCQNGPRYIT